MVWRVMHLIQRLNHYRLSQQSTPLGTSVYPAGKLTTNTYPAARLNSTNITVERSPQYMTNRKKKTIDREKPDRKMPYREKTDSQARQRESTETTTKCNDLS
jgi:hypothetical protein